MATNCMVGGGLKFLGFGSYLAHLLIRHGGTVGQFKKKIQQELRFLEHPNVGTLGPTKPLGKTLTHGANSSLGTRDAWLLGKCRFSNGLIFLLFSASFGRKRTDSESKLSATTQTGKLLHEEEIRRHTSGC